MINLRKKYTKLNTINTKIQKTNQDKIIFIYNVINGEKLYLNNFLLFTSKKYEWIFNDFIIKSHDNRALDSWIDPEDHNSNEVILYYLNESNNQKFRLINNNIQTFYGNKILSIDNEKKVGLGLGFNKPLYYQIKEKEIKINYLSYNILVGLSEYEDELIHSKPEFRNWSKRKDKIKKIILKSDLGVLVESIESLLPEILPNNYSYCFVNKKNNLDGTTIFYNNNKFDLVDEFKSYLFSDTNQVVLRIILSEKSTDKYFAIIGLHLKSGYAELEYRRTREMSSALSKALDGLPDDMPIIISGDFNCDSLGDYDRESLKIIESLDFKNIPLEENQITYNHWHESIFDYIYVKGNISFKKAFTNVKKKSKPAPNDKQGSDHFPLQAKLILN